MAVDYFIVYSCGWVIMCEKFRALHGLWGKTGPNLLCLLHDPHGTLWHGTQASAMWGRWLMFWTLDSQIAANSFNMNGCKVRFILSFSQLKCQSTRNW